MSGKNPTGYQGCCAFDSDGYAVKCGSECANVKLIVNASNVWYRTRFLMCRFNTAGTDEEFPPGSSGYSQTLVPAIIPADKNNKFEFGFSEFECQVPDLKAGTHSVSFSNNEGRDFAPWMVIPQTLVSKGCQAGFVSADPSKPCTQCLAGTYKANEAECRQCDLTYYQSLPGQKTCLSCPKNSKTVGRGSPGIDSCLCEPGFYTPNGAFNTEDCIVCPQDAVCQGGTTLPFATEGFANHANRSFNGLVTACRGVSTRTECSTRFAKDLVTMLECMPPTACIGGIGAPLSPCKLGYQGFRCSECASGFYRFSHYCVDCPGPVLVRYLYVLQMCLFSFAVMLFLAHFETVSKVASIQILVRFVQVTFMMSFYELSWQGGHAKKWLHKAGAPQTINNLPYSKDIFAMEWTSIYKAVSYLMPAMYFPAFAETAALGCDTENPSFADWSIVVVLGLPTLIVGGRWLMWARKYRPQYSLSGAVVMVKSAWNERGMKHSTRHGQNKGAAVAKTNNGPQIGQHELERMRGGVVGLFVMLLPFLLRHALKVVNCDETTVGVACMPDTFFKMVGSAAIWFALIGLGVLFLNGNPKSGYAYFLTKSKNQTQNKDNYVV